MKTIRLESFLLATAVAVAVWMPAAAWAGTITSAPCINSNELLSVRGGGWQPNTRVELSFDGQSRGMVRSDAQGRIRARLNVGPEANARTSVVSVSDGASQAKSRVRVVFPYVKTGPGAGFVTQRVTVWGRGFTAGKPLYVHYRSGTRVVTTRLLGRTGAWGAFRKTLHLHQFRGLETGAWQLVFGTSRRLPRHGGPGPIAVMNVSYGGKVGPENTIRTGFLVTSTAWLEHGGLP